MKTILPILCLTISAVTLRAAPLAVGSISENRAFSRNTASGLANRDFNDYEGKILVVMLMTPWCPICQSHAQAVGDGILNFFNASSRGANQGKNNRGIPIQSILLSTEEAEQWDSVNDSFSSTNGYDQWGLDANANRNNPRTMLGYFRGGFINSSNLYDWGNDRRRVIVLNLVKNSATHGYREIVINQNAYSSGDNTAARAAINAIQPPAPIIAPAINTHPISATINSGGSVTLRVTASGTSPDYQWYIGASGVTTSPVSGATSATYVTPALTANRNYWARASNSSGNANSNAAIITVNPPVIAPAITTHPASASLVAGGSVTLQVAASGTSPQFQWYVGASGVTSSPVSGATSATFTTPALTTGRTYWARASNSSGGANSNAATITVTPATTTFAQWSSGQSYPPGESGAGGDPDRDGIPNLLEFFHGTDPLLESSGQTLMKFDRGTSGRPSITYRRARGNSGLTVYHEHAFEISGWTPIPDADLSISTRDLGSADEVTVSLPVNNSPNGFYRLRVVTP